jgi:hypothetical protein
MIEGRCRSMAANGCCAASYDKTREKKAARRRGDFWRTPKMMMLSTGLSELVEGVEPSRYRWRWAKVCRRRNKT